MRKILFILLFLLLILVACDSNNKKDTSIENKNTISEIIEEPDVEIVLSPSTFDEDVTIEEYVNDLNTENEITYYVYDENHYAFLIKEGERKEMLSLYETEDVKNEIILSLNNEFPGVFKNIKFKEQGKTIELYVGKENYQNAAFGVEIVSAFVCSVISDNLQGYNLIPLEQREFNFEILDYKTQEIIYVLE